MYRQSNKRVGLVEPHFGPSQVVTRFPSAQLNLQGLYENGYVSQPGFQVTNLLQMLQGLMNFRSA